MKASKVSVLIIAGALITGLAAAGAARTGVAEELWRSLALLAAAGVFVFLATTTARFHRLLALASASPGALAARTAVAMPRRRVWMVHCLIAVIIAGHLYCIASREEHWPFSL
jgi:hypothetical protein